MRLRPIRTFAAAVLSAAATLLFWLAIARPAATGTDAAPAAAPAATKDDQGGRWLPGDTHSHISPPDVPPAYKHAENDLDGAVASAREAGLAWLIITPHAMDRKNEKTGRLWAEDMAARLAERKAAAGDPLVVLGWERTYNWPGHMTVSFADLKEVCGQPLEKVLEKVREQGGLTIAAHPFSTPNMFVKADRSWRPWAAGPKGRELDPWLSGLEIRHPTSPAAAATKHWDEWIARERRRIVGLGATDDHWGTLYPTTWVYVEGQLTREKLHAALVSGRIVVGDDASAGTLTVTSDRKAPDGKPVVGRVGEAIAADRRITINWMGEAKCFLDGQRMCTSLTGPAACDVEPGSFHWVRLEVGSKSYGNPVYINLPEPKKPEPMKLGDDQPRATRDVESETRRPSQGTSQ